MEEKIKSMQNNTTLDDKIISVMDELDVEETTSLLKNIDMHNAGLKKEEIEKLKVRTLKKVNLTPANREQEGGTAPLNVNTGGKDKSIYRNRFAVAAAAVLLCIVILQYNNIAYAFQQMLSLIPGVGIIENDREIMYQLKEPVFMEDEQATLTITSAVASNQEITIRFEFARKNYTEEQLMADKDAEWENLKKGGEMKKPNIYLQVDSQEYHGYYGSSGSGLKETFSYTFELAPEHIDSSKNYKLVYEDYNISADFKLVTLEQYSSLNEIGITAIHNNISLTATSSLENNELKVHVYPLNYSDYNLISFDREYDFNYFDKKLVLQTDKGDKTYTLPDSYGSGMNAAYTFDLSDGAKYNILSIPYIVVESKEEAKVTLPIPEEGVILPVNKEVFFDEGSVIIKNVEKITHDEENNQSDFYAELKVDLEYKSKASKQQLVGIDLTNKKSEGKSWEYDEQYRIKTIYYMLDKPDKSKIKLYLTKPRYVLMEEYNLDLSEDAISEQ